LNIVYKSYKGSLSHPFAIVTFIKLISMPSYSSPLHYKGSLLANTSYAMHQQYSSYFPTCSSHKTTTHVTLWHVAELLWMSKHSTLVLFTTNANHLWIVPNSQLGPKHSHLITKATSLNGSGLIRSGRPSNQYQRMHKNTPPYYKSSSEDRLPT